MPPRENKIFHFGHVKFGIPVRHSNSYLAILSLYQLVSLNEGDEISLSWDDLNSNRSLARFKSDVTGTNPCSLPNIIFEVDTVPLKIFLPGEVTA
jgi:hypothetical protein